MKKYEVGQIIYLLSPKTLKVLPSLIVEEITRKTVEETQTQFVIQMPDEKKTKVNNPSKRGKKRKKETTPSSSSLIKKKKNKKDKKKKKAAKTIIWRV